MWELVTSDAGWAQTITTALGVVIGVPVGLALHDLFTKKK